MTDEEEVDWSKVKRDFRHAKRRRYSVADELKPEIQKLCVEKKIEFRILNGETHWQFKKSGAVLNFYPATWRMILNGDYEGRSFSFYNPPPGTKNNERLFLALRELAQCEPR